MHAFIHSWIHSFVHSFVHSFTHSSKFFSSCFLRQPARGSGWSVYCERSESTRGSGGLRLLKRTRNSKLGGVPGGPGGCFAGRCTVPQFDDAGARFPPSPFWCPVAFPFFRTLSCCCSPHRPIPFCTFQYATAFKPKSSSTTKSFPHCQQVSSLPM